jgi:hypothetical protein
VLDDPRGQLGAVVDDDLRPRVGDGEQIRVELLARDAVCRMHLDPASTSAAQIASWVEPGFEPEATTSAPASARSVAR